MAKGVTFTKESADRIGKAVRRVEGMPQGPGVGPANRNVYTEEPSFWARITGANFDGSAWSWIKVAPDPASHGGFTFATDPPVIGDENAYETNGNHPPDNAIVRLYFVGYDNNGKPWYRFCLHNPFQPYPLPIHDHRDNNNGGFAFACYHPGTSLPQISFAT